MQQERDSKKRGRGRYGLYEEKKEEQREREKEKREREAGYALYTFLANCRGGIARSLLHKLVSLLFSVTRGKSPFRIYSARDSFFCKIFVKFSEFTLSLFLLACVSIRNKTRIFFFLPAACYCQQFWYYMIQKNKFFIQYFSEHRHIAV